MKALVLTAYQWRVDKTVLMEIIEKEITRQLGERSTGCIYAFLAVSGDEALPEDPK